MTITIALKNPLSIALSVLLMAGSLCFGAWLTRFGVNFADEPCHFVNSMHWRDFPEAPLTYFLGEKWGNLTGWNWLSLRLLGWIFNMGGIIVTSCFVGKITGYQNRWWRICALLIFLASLQGFTMTLWGYDAPAYFGTAVTLIACLSYCNRPSLARLIWLSLWVTLTMWARIPCGILLLIVPVTILILRKKESVIALSKEIIIFFLCVIGCSAILLTGLYGNPGIWFMNVFRGEYGGNGLWMCISASINTTFQFIPIIGIYTLIFIISHSICKWPGKSGRILAFLLLVISVTIFFWMRYGSLSIHYPCALLILSIGYMFSQKDTDKKFMACILLAFAEVTAIGSNTGTAKLMTWAIFPIIAFELRHILSQQWVRMALLCIISAFIINMLHLSSSKSYADVGFLCEHAALSHPRFKGMLTSPERASQINRITEAVQQKTIDESKIMVVGDETSRYLYEYLYHAPNMVLQHDWGTSLGHDSYDYVRAIETATRGSEGASILYLSLRDRGTSRATKMRNMLDTIMHRGIQDESFILYVPKTTHQ